MADWKTLWERYRELPIETRIKLMQAFRSKSEDELRDLFKREPFAAMLFGKLRDDEVRGLLGPRKIEARVPAVPVREKIDVASELEKLQTQVKEKEKEYLEIARQFDLLQDRFRKLEEKPELSALRSLESELLDFPVRLSSLKTNYEGLRARASEIYDKVVEIPDAEQRLSLLKKVDSLMKADIDMKLQNIDFFKHRVDYMVGRVKELIEKAVAPLLEKVKVRFLVDTPSVVGADMKLYGPFKAGDIVELPKANADAFVKQGVASYELIPKPAELPTEEIERLRTVVRVKADELGIEWSPELWSRFWIEYEARAKELWRTQRVSYLEDEIEVLLKAVAPAPTLPPPVPKVAPPPKEVVVEAPREVFVEPVEVPKEPISTAPFPRSPTSEERERLWRAFMYEMSRIGQDAYRWREAFRMHVLDRPYKLWVDLVNNFKGFIEAIRTGKEFRLLPLVTLPMPWSEEEEKRRYDAILHFIATKLYPSMDELLQALYSYGVQATEDDVKKAVKKGYAEKNVWFTSVPKEFLEALIGEKIE